MKYETGEMRLAGPLVARVARAATPLTKHPQAMSVALLWMLSFAACAEWRRISTLEQYRHQVLRVKDSGPGAERLPVEAEHDPAVRNFIKQDGNPDYILVEDVESLRLMYIDEDRVVDFKKHFWDVGKRATVSDRIPDEISAMFTRTDRERLAAVRAKGGTRSQETLARTTTQASNTEHDAGDRLVAPTPGHRKHRDQERQKPPSAQSTSTTAEPGRAQTPSEGNESATISPNVGWLATRKRGDRVRVCPDLEGYRDANRERASDQAAEDVAESLHAWSDNLNGGFFGARMPPQRDFCYTVDDGSRAEQIGKARGVVEIRLIENVEHHDSLYSTDEQTGWVSASHFHPGVPPRRKGQ